MSATLLERFLETYDPQYLGRRPWQWSAGMAATLGRAWTGIMGQHNLYRGTGGVVDYDVPVGAVSPTDADPDTVRNYPTFPLAASTEYVFAVRAVGRGGAEEQNTDLVHTLTTDADGAPLGPAPNPPINVTAAPQAGGKILLAWQTSPRGEAARAASFHIYHDDGSGTVDFSEPLASTVRRSYLTDAYADGTTVKFVVRAVSADDVEEANTNTVSATADAAGPPDMAAPDVEYGTEN